MYITDSQNGGFMSHSITQTRQQLSALIDLAQTTPQVITRHNTPVAVLVSNDYFERTVPAVQPKLSFYEEFLAIREKYSPLDDEGFDLQFQIEKDSMQLQHSSTSSS
jgi:prevent-host-death family protein